MSLRAVIITQEDCLYLPQFLHTVLRHRRANVVGMTILPALMPKQTWSTTMRDHLAVYGPTQFVRQGVRFLYVETWAFIINVLLFHALVTEAHFKEETHWSLPLLARMIGTGRNFRVLRACAGVGCRRFLAGDQLADVARRPSVAPATDGQVPGHR